MSEAFLDDLEVGAAGEQTRGVRVAQVVQGRRVLAGIESAGRVVLGGVGRMPYSAIGTIHNDPVDPMPTHEAATLLRSLPPEAVDTVIGLAGPDAACPQVIVELRHLGGAIAREQGGPTAMSHRGAAYSFQTIGIAAPPVVEATRGHSAAALSALAPWSDGSCLPNSDASAQPADFARKYDRATLERLAALADAYDPARVVAFADLVRAAVESTP